MIEIKKMLKTIEVEKLAKTTGFTKKCDKKVTATAFLLSFFKIFLGGRSYSLRLWASEAGFLIGETLSKPGILKNLTYRHEVFVLEFFKEILSDQTAMPNHLKKVASPLFVDFKRVLVEDATHLKLPSNLASYIQGPNNPKGDPVSTAKIHLQMDLKTDEFLDYQTGCFRDSDRVLSRILETIQENDLVIRDLGYWNMQEFKDIDAKGAYYLSKYKRGTNLFNEDREKIDIYKLLRKAEKKGLKQIDIKILLGSKLKLKTRLVAVKLTDSQANEARRKAKKNRDKRMKYSKDFQIFLGWSVLITNVSESVWKPKAVGQAYAFRWRIEIVFKCWKSHLKVNKFFEKESLTHPQALIVLHLLLISLSLFFLSNYRKYYAIIFEKFKARISMQKFAAFFIENFQKIVMSDSEPCPLLLKTCAYHCKYDKRIDRLNHEEKMMQIIVNQENELKHKKTIKYELS